MQDKDKLNDKDWLYQKYIVEQLNFGQISKLIGCDKQIIIRRLKKFDIRVRTKKESAFLKKNGVEKQIIDKFGLDFLKNEYFNKRTTITDIAKIVGCHMGVLSRIFDRLGFIKIPIKERSEWWKLANKLGREYFYQLYIIENISAHTLSKSLKISQKAVRNILEYFEIPIRVYLKSKLIDLTGEKFGFLQVIEREPSRDKYKTIHWKCLCDCGNYTSTASGSLLRRNTISCGCKGGAYKDIRGHYWASVRSQAKDRDLSFNITPKYIWELYEKQNKKCALSGVDIKFTRQDSSIDRTASIDRTDSSTGYEEGDIQLVHKNLNLMKLDFTQEEFINWCSKVHVHQNQQSFDKIDYII